MLDLIWCFSLCSAVIVLIQSFWEQPKGMDNEMYAWKVDSMQIGSMQLGEHIIVLSWLEVLLYRPINFQT